MGEIRIIPAIDIIEGKCVRLTQGNYSNKKIYNENPIEVALQFQDHGFQYLHLVDLDGAKTKSIVNHKILESIVSKTSLDIDFAGGIQSDKDVKIAFECGAKQITLGSLAIKNPELFLDYISFYGNDKIILGADTKDNKIAISAWTENSDKDIFEFLDYYIAQNVKYVVCTDISKDGMLEGPAIGLYRNIMTKYPNIKLIASGGVSSIDDIHNLSLLGLDGVIIGKAIYEQKIKIEDIENHFFLK
jgi:phosphoribosylformimino-5-aminoimidazole carboxamide ribotide isomerase